MEDNKDEIHSSSSDVSNIIIYYIVDHRDHCVTVKDKENTKLYFYPVPLQQRPKIQYWVNRNGT